MNQKVNSVTQAIKNANDKLKDSEEEAAKKVKLTKEEHQTVREVYFCTNCLKKGLSEKEKNDHAEETGHKLEKIKVPKNMPIYI